MAAHEDPRPLIRLARRGDANQISGFLQATRALEREDLAALYAREIASAPRRRAAGKAYLVGHDGIPGSGHETNRREELLAIALFNDHQPGKNGLPLPGGERLGILDYQFPLKAWRADEKVGKADLLGIGSTGIPWVIELKSEEGKDTPLRGLLEALAYSAIVGANLDDIRREIEAKTRIRVAASAPAIGVVAPVEYWEAWRRNPAAGDWAPELQKLASRITATTGSTVHFLALRNWHWQMAGDGRPRLKGPVACETAL